MQVVTNITLKSLHYLQAFFIFAIFRLETFFGCRFITAASNDVRLNLKIFPPLHPRRQTIEISTVFSFVLYIVVTEVLFNELNKRFGFGGLIDELRVDQVHRIVLVVSL